MNDKNWREEYKGMKPLNKKQIQLLDEGAKSLSQSWFIQAMYIDWKKIKGYKTPEPPNCQSSFKEFESRINQSTINKPENESD